LNFEASFFATPRQAIKYKLVNKIKLSYHRLEITPELDSFELIMELKAIQL
jgi:hypothetical protein